MRKFDTKLLVLGRGEFGPHPLAGLFIRIPLDPFRLDGATVKTSVRLDFVRLPDVRWDALAHQTFQFPQNPEAGFIDGSMYIDGAHHPIDVTKVAFGQVTGGAIRATFTSVIDFAFEGLGDFVKTPWTFAALLAWTSEAQTA